MKKSKIYIAGHTGLVGNSILNKLKSNGYTNFVFTPHSKYDLRDYKQVEDFFKKEKPDYVFLAAAKVGGINANNTYRAEFLFDNIQIQNNIIHHSYLNNVKKLIFLGSSCIYPKNCPQPIKEEYLLTSELEDTNEPYAIAKISGIKMIENYNLQYGTNFISLMPTNLYGINDNFNLETSHVLPALIRKFYLAKMLETSNYFDVMSDLDRLPIKNINGKSNIIDIFDILNKEGIFENKLELWGTGKPRREFLHSDDLADAITYIFEYIDFDDIYNIKKTYKNTHINIGTGEDISIEELAYLIKDISKFKGHIEWNTDMPDGTLQKKLDVKFLDDLGWSYNIKLEDGLNELYEKYK